MSVLPETLKKPEIVALGDGQVFIKRTSSGQVKSVKGFITLREQLGQLAEISNKIMITASGYNELNKIASISVITPEKLVLPSGETVVNPYPIIDPLSKTIEKVWVKKMAVGFGPIGNLVITTSTLLYDITMYFIQDLAKKIQTNKNAGKICMKSTLTSEELQKGVFHAIQGELGVWADYNNPEVLKALDTFIQNKLFAERKAQTICERLVMKKHPALSTVNVLSEGPLKARISKVEVIGFCHDFTREDLLEIAQKAADEGAGGEMEVKGHRVQTIDVSGEVTDDEISAGAEGDEGSGGGEDNSSSEIPSGQLGLY